jgi:hypothetical protein
MSSNQTVHTPMIDAQTADAPVRELSLAELEDVAGGLPNGTWNVPMSEVALDQADPTSLPNGTW